MSYSPSEEEDDPSGGFEVFAIERAFKVASIIRRKFRGPQGVTEIQITNHLDIARQARDAGIAGQGAAGRRQGEEDRKKAAIKAAADRSATAMRGSSPM